MKWLPVYHVSTIFGNHVTAGVLWVKVTFLSACQQTKWRPDRTKFDGEIVSQTRVPPVSIPMYYLFSTLRVKIFLVPSKPVLWMLIRIAITLSDLLRQCPCLPGIYMSRDARKPVFVASDQVQHKPGCATTEDG